MPDADSDTDRPRVDDAVVSAMFDKMRIKDDDDERTRISKKLSYVLRHGGKQLGLDIDASGFVQIEELLACEPIFGGVTLDLLLSVVEKSNVDKQRYEVVEDDDGFKCIRASGKHTMQGLSSKDRKDRQRRNDRESGGDRGGGYKQRRETEDEFCEKFELDRLARQKLMELPPPSRQIAMQRFAPGPQVPPEDFPKVFVAFCKRFRGKGKEGGSAQDSGPGRGEKLRSSGGKTKAKRGGEREEMREGRSRVESGDDDSGMDSPGDGANSHTSDRYYASPGTTPRSAVDAPGGSHMGSYGSHPPTPSALQPSMSPVSQHPWDLDRLDGSVGTPTPTGASAAGGGKLSPLAPEFKLEDCLVDVNLDFKASPHSPQQMPIQQMGMPMQQPPVQPMPQPQQQHGMGLGGMRGMYDDSSQHGMYAGAQQVTPPPTPQHQHQMSQQQYHQPPQHQTLRPPHRPAGPPQSPHSPIQPPPSQPPRQQQPQQAPPPPPPVHHSEDHFYSNQDRGHQHYQGGMRKTQPNQGMMEHHGGFQQMQQQHHQPRVAPPPPHASRPQHGAQWGTAAPPPPPLPQQQQQQHHQQQHHHQQQWGTSQPQRQPQAPPPPPQWGSSMGHQQPQQRQGNHGAQVRPMGSQGGGGSAPSYGGPSNYGGEAGGNVDGNWYDANGFDPHSGSGTRGWDNNRFSGNRQYPSDGSQNQGSGGFDGRGRQGGDDGNWQNYGEGGRGGKGSVNNTAGGSNWKGGGSKGSWKGHADGGRSGPNQNFGSAGSQNYGGGHNFDSSGGKAYGHKGGKQSRSL